MNRPNDKNVTQQSPGRIIKVGDIVRYYEKTVVASGNSVSFVFTGEDIQVTKITQVDDTTLLWSGERCYLAAEAFPTRWLPEDFASMLQLINAAISFDELAEVTRILKVLCTQSLKEQVWNRLTPIAQTKFIAHKQAVQQRA